MKNEVGTLIAGKPAGKPDGENIRIEKSSAGNHVRKIRFFFNPVQAFEFIDPVDKFYF